MHRTRTDVGETGRPLTRAEAKAIADLKALARRWPQTLRLFSWSGSLVVFKEDEWAARKEADEMNDYTVDTIVGIPNDGGDP